MKLSGFLVDLRRDAEGPVAGSMLVLVSEIVWPFAQRLWRQLRGSAEMPGNVRPLMYMRPDSSGTLTEPPPTIGHTADSDWSLHPVASPHYPFVEFRLSIGDEELSRGLYRLDDIFSGPLTTVCDLFTSEGKLLCPPGRYLYDIYAVAPARERLERLERFSRGSFELPLLNENDPLLDFERLEDQPLLPALGARSLFVVPGAHRIGETRFAADAWENLALTLPMSLDREIGGYLVGSVGQGENGDETVTIHHAVPAELSAGDAHILLMSPESGAEIRQRIQKEWPGDELVGWYHTHVFSAKNDVLSGLSETDEKTHDEQFTRSWQLAVLVNIWREGGTVSRQVRSFRRNAKGKLVDVDYVVVEGKAMP